MRKMIINFRAGEKTCAESKGKFCPFMRTWLGDMPTCVIFDEEFLEVENWLVMRCKECLEGEIEV